MIPAAITALRKITAEYLKLTKVPAASLTVLYGLFQPMNNDLRVVSKAPYLKDSTRASDGQLQALGRLIDDDALRSVVPGGPFAAGDLLSARRSFGLGLLEKLTFPEWCARRDQLWSACRPWTEGLETLFAGVQDELQTQFGSLSNEAALRQLIWEHLSPLEGIMLRHFHEMRPAPNGGAFGTDKWRQLLASLDSNGITLDDNLPKLAKAVLLKARAKRSITTWIEAYNYKVAVPLWTGNESSEGQVGTEQKPPRVSAQAKRRTLRREITHHLLNVARCAEGKWSRFLPSRN